MTISDKLKAAIRSGSCKSVCRDLGPKPFIRIGEFRDELVRANLYESVLVSVYRTARDNRAEFTTEQIVAFFEFGNRDEFQACGQHFSPEQEFDLFRGVAGVEPRRKAAGLSWTSCRRVACWFAWQTERFRDFDPAVYVATISAADVFVVHDKEREVIARPPAQITRLDLTVEDIEREHDAHQATVEAIFRGGTD